MAGQRIIFGWHLDGQRTTAPVDAIGVSVVGPLGFLTILETQLGLLTLHPSQAERVVQYCECLQKLDSDRRFYHASLATDPLGTAACLLDWRDQWALHGWDGGMPSDAPTRLRDLAAVETVAVASVAPNVGQRLKAVTAALARTKPDIDEVRLADPVAIFPARWQVVLADLPVREMAANEGGGRGFLGALQSRLRQASAGRIGEKLKWRDDGSVVVVQAETRALAAHWLAPQIEDDGRQTLLVCGEDGARLDAYLAAAKRPRQGLKEASAFRPALQVLPLALELLWDPLNFYALIQFLTHPVCPIPGFARRRLAEKVAEAPGIGGANWQRTLARIEVNCTSEQAQRAREEVAFWIEHERFPNKPGAPIRAVIERVKRLTEFFRQRLGDSDEARRMAFHAGYGQCRSCLDSLEALLSQGADRIRPRQLQKLVSEATASGSDNQLWPAEVGAGQMVTQPGAVIEPIARVIWWQMAMPRLPGNEPWSVAEMCALRAVGVRLPDASDRLQQIAADWLRPVMAVREQLLLVLPPQGEELHPLWLMIRAVVEQPNVTAVENSLTSGGMSMTVVDRVPLPAPKRWWQLPDDVAVTLRERESFSSLEQLLFCPYQWLLRYRAGLRASRIVSMGSEFRMLGNLAHGLVARYFQHADCLTMSQTDFDAWFDRSFREIVDEEGALLRMPGRGADLEGFRYRLQRSLQALREQVDEAGIVKVIPELELSGYFVGGELVGSADLVMHTTWDDRAIVDMKWSGFKKFPDKLRQNRHLQLAIYAELMRQQTGQWPAVAYYILDKARFFAPDDRAFPDAEVIASVDGENTAQLWQRFLATWHWRAEQIRAGRFEVALDGIALTDESIPPGEAMAMETLSEAYNDYWALAGWED